jgi:ubiquinone/menaquinone biosynthesis C-methylase UbiE
MKADYGIDAPGIVRFQILLTLAGFGLWTLTLLRFIPSQLGGSFAVSVSWGSLLAGVWGVAGAGVFLWSSRYGKIRVRDKILDTIPWRGDETVLDVGCGRGLLLIGAAKRLKTGKSVGVDIWNSRDLSGNRPEATLQNAAVEGVAGRVEVKDGDARQLPFPDSTFDVVLSSLALHNIKGKESRAKAVNEIVRVLKPGGFVAIADIFRASEYERVLREKGLSNVNKTSTFLFFQLFRTITARKPEHQ